MNDFEDKLKRNLEEVLDKFMSKENLNSIAQQIVDQIVLRTKLGKGVDGPKGKEIPLKKLSEPYKKTRKKLKLDESATPSKSNLTQTGDMLRGVKFKLEGGDEIVIFIEGDDNNDKARWQAKQGREFLHISDVQNKRLYNLINTKLNEIFKKNWNK